MNHEKNINRINLLKSFVYMAIDSAIIFLCYFIAYFAQYKAIALPNVLFILVVIVFKLIAANIVGIYKTLVNHFGIGDLIRFCAPRIEHRDERYRQLKQYSETKPIVSFSNLSRFINISRQTLYNWKDEGWIITDHNGKADLRRTVELWEECSWNA